MIIADYFGRTGKGLVNATIKAVCLNDPNGFDFSTSMQVQTLQFVVPIQTELAKCARYGLWSHQSQPFFHMHIQFDSKSLNSDTFIRKSIDFSIHFIITAPKGHHLSINAMLFIFLLWFFSFVVYHFSPISKHCCCLYKFNCLQFNQNTSGHSKHSASGSGFFETQYFFWEIVCVILIISIIEIYGVHGERRN